MFEKAGQPGWAALIPIYNGYVLTCEFAKKEVLWFILLFIPLVGIFSSFIIAVEVARKFGKSDGFGVGLFFLPFIFYPMLAFGDARYQRGRRRRDEDEDDEDYDRPRRPRPDEDDEDDRPRRRRPSED